MERQKLHDHVDSAAHAGAFELPASGPTPRRWAVAMAKTQDSTMTPDTELFCVVASTGAGKQVATGADPGHLRPRDLLPPPRSRCNTKICSIPCPTTARCNTIRVSDSKDVDFDFAPIIGRKKGSTGLGGVRGLQGARAGTTLPNPMDVVIMADRTTSMARRRPRGHAGGHRRQPRRDGPDAALRRLRRACTRARPTSTCATAGHHVVRRRRGRQVDPHRLQQRLPGQPATRRSTRAASWSRA